MYKYCKKLRFPHLNISMKKFIILSVSILLSFFLSACGTRDNQNHDKVQIKTNAVEISTAALEAKNAYSAYREIANTEIQNEEIGNEQTAQKITVDNNEKDDDYPLLNSITIPNACNNASLAIGSTQKAVDQYDICIMTEAASLFGFGKPVLLGGHNTKSLKYLYRASINDVISVNYNSCIYNYKIVYSNECNNDGHQLYDVETGEAMLDYNLDQEILYIYTCYGRNNWLIKALKL